MDNILYKSKLCMIYEKKATVFSLHYPQSIHNACLSLISTMDLQRVLCGVLTWCALGIAGETYTRIR